MGAPKTIKVSITNVRALCKEDVVMKTQLKDWGGGEKDCIFWLFITGYLSLTINVNIFLMVGNAVV